MAVNVSELGANIAGLGAITQAANSNLARPKGSHTEFSDEVANLWGAGVQPQGQNLLQGHPIVNTGKGAGDGEWTMAVQGDGFLKVQTPPNGDAYMQSGSFHIDASGYVVNHLNQPLQPPVQVPEGSGIVEVTSHGTMTIQDAAGNKTTVTLEVFKFPNAGGLQKMGDTQWVVTGFSGAPASVPKDAVHIAGGASETPDRSAQHLASVIAAQREYISNPTV